MGKNNISLFLIIFFGFILRLTLLGINRENKNVYFGHSLNMADMAVQFVLHKEIGVFNPEHANMLHSAAISKNKLVDPQDLRLDAASQSTLIADYENEVGLGVLTGFIWTLTKDMRFIYIQLFQVLIDVFCIALVFFTVRNIFNTTVVALIGAFLYAIFYIQIYLVTFPAPYPWMVYLSVFVLYLMSKIYGSRQSQTTFKKALMFVIVGLAVGAFTYMRSSSLYLGAFLAASLILKEKAASVVKYGAIIIFAEIIILSPLLVRNYKAFGKIMLTRGNFWHSVWVGMGGHKNTWGIVYNDDAVAESVLREHPNIEKYKSEYEQILKTKCIKAIEDHPFWFIRMFCERILRFVFPVSWTKEGYPYFSIKKTAAILPMFILGVWGAWIVFIEKRLPAKDLLLFLTPTLYFFISTIIVQPPQIKYVYPGYVFMLMLSAFSLEKISGKVKFLDLHRL